MSDSAQVLNPMLRAHALLGQALQSARIARDHAARLPARTCTVYPGILAHVLETALGMAAQDINSYIRMQDQAPEANTHEKDAPVPVCRTDIRPVARDYGQLISDSCIVCVDA